MLSFYLVLYQYCLLALRDSVLHWCSFFIINRSSRTMYQPFYQANQSSFWSPLNSRHLIVSICIFWTYFSWNGAVLDRKNESGKSFYLFFMILSFLPLPLSLLCLVLFCLFLLEICSFLVLGFTRQQWWNVPYETGQKNGPVLFHTLHWDTPLLHQVPFLTRQIKHAQQAENIGISLCSLPWIWNHSWAVILCSFSDRE